ncbi:tetratricopeptide (TPR) repeat protein [Catalinimonas alkaloidigena]|uniref:tetratricopeptide repeat protein n=1 Tax=Catalinimonas alkaloidigena TaxID=1075417 RepID=UPI0024072934|nr:tetratricopeptide repeat protein [Catalinimonas alkaloidigena]MDF9794976.1 tetratricopeptide (TPR) repeat protein [Catalinimonas alkaloidigena]
MNNPIDDSTIQRYLDDDMSGVEKAEFEAALSSNIELQRVVAEYRNLSEGILFQKRRAMWSKIQDMEAEAERTSLQNNRTNLTNWLPWSIAAAIALLIVGGILLWNEQQPTSQELFADNFSPYPALAYAPDRSDTLTESLKEQAYRAYSNENYSQAVSFFEQMIAEENDTLTWFYLGNAYLENDEPPKAINALNKFLEYDTELKTQAQWYLGLAYLSAGDTEKAKGVLDQLSKSNTSYAENAKEIILHL